MLGESRFPGSSHPLCSSYTILLPPVWPQVRLEGGCAQTGSLGQGRDPTLCHFFLAVSFPGQAQEQGFVLTQLLMPIAPLSAPAPWREQALLPDRVCTGNSQPMASPVPGEVGLGH